MKARHQLDFACLLLAAGGLDGARTNGAFTRSGWIACWRTENNALDSAGADRGILQNGAAFSLDDAADFVQVPHRLAADIRKGSPFIAGVLNPPSDREAKQNFALVDLPAVLETVAALPIQSWTYKDSPDVRHVGSVAQDFHAAFQLNGGDDKHIGTVDADGVALAAIQGLNEKVEVRSEKLEIRSQKSERRIQKLEAENAQLKLELENLRRLVDNLTDANP